ncbi:LysR family transcriptional regulator [Azospirillum thermophilum]|uniref:LysR family transcriptional regulator n=1 Tax=Azospirillum thermophilum TaxID=2202148 RepID=A0A2S2CVB9_9PROT|nr:LysR family transcriptional regulator [Azospirillum thermophilum]AWK88463.1 LysR family transcriptional regulator [Azospirillum thermophilum]
MLDWNDLRYFLSIARTGSLTAAAAELRVSPSTAGRRIESLEQALAVTLFARHQTGYFLTDAGRALLTRAEAVADGVAALQRSATGLDGDLAGTVRLATAETLANSILVPALPAFRAEHPRLALELVTGITTIGLSRREADLALRLVRPEEQTLHLRRLCRQGYGLYGAAGYLEARPWRGVERLADHALVGWEERFSHLPAARWLAGAMAGGMAGGPQDGAPWLRTTSLSAQAAAAAAGLGLAVLPCFLGDGEPGLRRLLGPREVFAEDLWLVLHGDLAHSARVRTVAEFVADTVLSRRALLEGDG